MIKIDGKKISQEILDKLKNEPKIKKFMAVFLVGSDLASENFVKKKESIAKELGVDFRVYRLDEKLTGDKLKEKMRPIISSKLCGGVVLQLPLPSGVNSSYVLNSIPPEKDPDVLSERSLGSFYNHRSKIVPPSAGTVESILVNLDISVSSLKSVAVVGQGTLIGKPITNWFLGKIPKIIALDKGDDFSILKEVDLVILGTGQSGLFKAQMFKEGAGVIDFGYGKNIEGKLMGDFDGKSIAFVGDDYLDFYTPTPGGTGPILIARLFENFYQLNGK